MKRKEAEELAYDALACWADDLDNGELRDLLLGNDGAYRGFPSVSRFVSAKDKQRIIKWRDKEE